MKKNKTKELKEKFQTYLENDLFTEMQKQQIEFYINSCDEILEAKEEIENEEELLSILEKGNSEIENFIHNKKERKHE